MLKLSGNSEQAFAQLNAINMNPVVWVEWNYNNLTKPYVVTSTSTGDISAASVFQNNLNDRTKWKGLYSGANSAGVFANYGPTFETVGPSNAIVLNTKSTLEYEKWTASGTFSSASNQWYKIVYYIRANMPSNIGNSQMISASNVTITASGPATAASANLYYRIVPVSSNGVRPLFDPNGTDIRSASSFHNASARVTWPTPTNVSTGNGPAAYDIYRSRGYTDPFPYLTTIPNISSNRSGSLTFFVDNLSNTTTTLNPKNYESMKIHFSANVKLYKSNNYIESTKSFTRYFSEETGTFTSKNQSFYIDGAKYYRVETFFGSPDAFDAAGLEIEFHGSYVGSSMLVSSFEVFKMDDWNFYNTEYFPIESVFNPHRPGEALLHPYLPSTDKKIKKTIGVNGIDKPVSLVFNAVDYINNSVNPFHQVRNSIFNTYKYYISPSKSHTNQTIIRAQYHNYLDINKIVVKTAIGGTYGQDSTGVNIIGDMEGVSGSITLLNGSNTLQTITFPAGAFDASGTLVLYYDGLSWSSTRGDWAPPTLTDSGVLQNVVSKVSGLIYTTNMPNKLIFDYDRSHIIEISPRLEVDVSGIVKGINCDKTIDDADSVVGFPFGFINSNRGSVDIHNIPVYKNSFPHTIFDNISESATFSDILRQGTKFTVGLTSPNLNFTENFIPFMTMFSDSWSFSDLDSVKVDLYDASKSYLMAMEAPPYLAWNESVFDTICNVLEVSGFSDYDHDGLREIMDRKQKSLTAFWCDRNKTLFDVLKEFFVANQIGASFDEYGILRFYDLDSYIYQYTSSSFAPNFIVSDVPQSFTNSSNVLINYEANMIQGTYGASIEKKVGKITIDYKIPSRIFTEDKGRKKDSPWGRVGLTPRPVYSEKNDTLLIKSWTNQSVYSKDRMMYIDPQLMSGGKVANTLGDWSGYAFMQGELISWDGFEYNFIANVPSNAPLVSKITNYKIDVTASTTVTATFKVAANHGIVTGQRIKFNGMPSTGGLNQLNYSSTSNNYYPIDSIPNSSSFVTVFDIPAGQTWTNGSGSISAGSAIIDSIQIHSAPKVSRSQEERNAQVLDLITSNSNINGVELEPSGKITGLQRGLRNTSIRNHILYDDSVPTRQGKRAGWETSDKGFVFCKLDDTGIRSYNQNLEQSKIKFENNTCHFVVHKNKTTNSRALAIYPKGSDSVLDYKVPVTASSFNAFSVVFQVPSSKKAVFTKGKNTVKLGIFINMGSKLLMLGLRDEHNDKKENAVVTAVGKYSDYVPSRVDGKASKHAPLHYLGNVFDGNKHRLTIMTDWNQTVWVYLDERQVGKYTYSQHLKKSIANQWGFYVENMMTSTSNDTYVNVDLHELYAVDTAHGPYTHENNLNDIKMYRHHWLNPKFLTRLLRNEKDVEPPYYFWGDNILTGVKIYDKTEFSTSPALEPTISIDKDFGYLPKNFVYGEPKYSRANLKDISVSEILASPFNFSTMIVNNTQSGGAIWLGTNNGNVGDGPITPFTLNATTFHLSDSMIYEKIINHSELSNSITLTTLWIQNTREADELIRQVEALANSFATHIDVTIFGNPLIQVGDICQFVYTLKKIGYDPENANARKMYCVVKGVNQSFEGGLKTTLSLRPLFKLSAAALE
jgi:hypothetical protein